VARELALVCADPARWAAVVAGLRASGHRVRELGEITTAKPPDLWLLAAETRAELELWARAAQPVPAFALGSDEVDAPAALELGLLDFVPANVGVPELIARIEARIVGHRAVLSLGRQKQEAELLIELTHALSSKLELREILQLVVRRIAEVVAVERVSIVLGGDNDVGYVIAASDDGDLRDLPIRLGDYPEIGRVLDTAMPLQIADAHGHPLFELSGVAGPLHFRALTLFPILFEGRAMGVLFLRDSQPRQLSEDEVYFLRALANTTGIALRNARLLRSLREQSRKSSFAHFEAELQLRALQRYVDFFDSSADGILVVALDGAILFCNPAACSITGRGVDELRTIRFDDLLPADGRRQFEQLKRSFERGVFANNVDLPIRTADGGRRILSVSFNSVLREEDGVIVSLRDVTADRAIARELTKTKEFLQRVIDSSVDAIVSADMRGNVLLFNPAAEKTYGYSTDEVIGKMNVAALYPGDTAREIMRQMRASSGVLQGYETQLLGKGGERIPVMLSAAIIVHRGRPIGSVGIFRDLRLSRQMEAHLALAQERLAAQEKKALIAELAGATAHELNQPLTAVMGYAAMIAKRSQDDERLARASQRIVTETERMAEIVRKIGRLTKYETKPYVGDTKIIDIDKSVDSEPPVTGY
jgi:PAS domain S-box-containing protein